MRPVSRKLSPHMTKRRARLRLNQVSHIEIRMDKLSTEHILATHSNDIECRIKHIVDHRHRRSLPTQRQQPLHETLCLGPRQSPTLRRRFHVNKVADRIPAQEQGGNELSPTQKALLLHALAHNGLHASAQCRPHHQRRLLAKLRKPRRVRRPLVKGAQADVDTAAPVDERGPGKKGEGEGWVKGRGCIRSAVGNASGVQVLEIGLAGEVGEEREALAGEVVDVDGRAKFIILIASERAGGVGLEKEKIEDEEMEERNAELGKVFMGRAGRHQDGVGSCRYEIKENQGQEKIRRSQENRTNNLCSLILFSLFDLVREAIAHFTYIMLLHFGGHVSFAAYNIL